MRRAFPVAVLALLIGAVAVGAVAQQRPPVQVNVMNVCTPDAADHAALSAALAQVTDKPAFGPDFEVARGRSTGPEGPSDWVRLRREFRRNPVLSNVQFLVTEGGGHAQQKLVFHAKADKIGEMLQVSLEAEPGSAPTRLRLERFGSPSLVLIGEIAAHNLAWLALGQHQQSLAHA